MKTISLIVPVVPFDKEIIAMTHKCIHKLIDYTVNPDWDIEIIVVSNGERCYNELKDLGPNQNIRIIHFPEMIGNPGAWNAGYLKCSGQIVCFMDNDVYVTRNWFAPIVRALNSDKCGLVVPDVFKLINGSWQSMNDSYQGCCIITKKETLEALYYGDLEEGIPAVIEPFDERFNPAYFEDNDFFMRCHKMGFDRHWAKDSRIYHHNETTCTVVLKEDRERHFKNSEMNYVKRWGPDNFLAPQEGAIG